MNEVKFDKSKKVGTAHLLILLQSGGCPANNSRCSYLRTDKRLIEGKCALQYPDIFIYGGKYSCSSFDEFGPRGEPDAEK